MNDRFLAIILLGCSGLILWETGDYPPGSKMLPVFLAVVVGLLTLPLLMKPKQAEQIRPLAGISTFIGLVMVSLLMLQYLGFFVFQIFIIVAGLLIQNVRDIKKICLAAVVITGIIYAVFIKLFQIPLPLFPG